MYKSRWGFHSISIEQFYRLKELHKEVWREYLHLCKAHRVYRKESQNWGDSPPKLSELKYLQKGVGSFPIYSKEDGKLLRKEIVVEKDGPDGFYSLGKLAGLIVDEMRNAKVPKTSLTEVIPCHPDVLALLSQA